MTADTASADPAAFDAIAADYDAGFSRTALGHILRKRAWRLLAQCFSSGQHVLELACGTGEDAVWLARRGVRVTATDGSSEMVRIVCEKAKRAGLADFLETEIIALQSFNGPMAPFADQRYNGTGHHFDGAGQRFDGAFSNFGGLNTIEHLRPLAEGLSRLVRPGGRLVLVLMGPLCPWEIAWFIVHGRPRHALRRFQRPATATIGERMIPIYYPSPGRLGRDFAPWFRLLSTESLGLWLPPTALGHLLSRWPDLWVAFSGLEALTAPHARGIGDHYMAVLERLRC